MERARSIPAGIWPQSTSLERERRIAEIAHDQWTVISLAQLTQLGLSDRAVRHRVAAGRLHRRYRGVYSVGHDVMPWQGHFMASVLACGDGAVASHQAAARVHGLLERAGRLHVTVPGRRVRVKGIDAHQTRSLAPHEIAIVQRIPCTSWARTIIDVACTTRDRRTVERMIDRAEQLRFFDLPAIRGLLDGGRRLSGARVVAELLGWPAEPARTRNELEERFFAICEAAGLPRPRVNMAIALDDGTHVEADFAWPELQLIVETDGWATHGTPLAFVNDRRRDRRLALEGWRVHHFTWHEIDDEPARVAEELGMLMALAS